MEGFSIDMLPMTGIIISVVALFLAAHTHKWMWYIWLVLSLLSGYYFMTCHLYGKLLVSTLAGILCLLPLSTWDKDEELNRENIEWGNPITAWVYSLAIGLFLFVLFRESFTVPIFECMGCGSMLMGLYLLSRNKVSSWIIFSYSFLMFSIMAIVTGEITNAIGCSSQLVFSLYGLVRYMEYYEIIKSKKQ